MDGKEIDIHVPDTARDRARATPQMIVRSASSAPRDLAQTPRHGQGGKDMSGSAAAGQHDSHSRRCNADLRDTFSNMPIISNEASNDEPPRLTNGSVRPVTGINPVTTPIFTKA